MNGEETLANLEKVSETLDVSLLDLIWENKGDSFGYPWPDIGLSFEFFDDGEIRISLPKNLMAETEKKITLTKAGMLDKISRADAVIVVDDALVQFGPPSHIFNHG